jgi:DeoR/GlpR family transcriptional regulator of sugar metabolism
VTQYGGEPAPNPKTRPPHSARSAAAQARKRATGSAAANTIQQRETSLIDLPAGMARRGIIKDIRALEPSGARRHLMQTRLYPFLSGES